MQKLIEIQDPCMLYWGHNNYAKQNKPPVAKALLYWLTDELMNVMRGHANESETPTKY